MSSVLLQAQTDNDDKRITIHVEQQSASAILVKIEKQAGANFSFNPLIFSSDELISFHADNIPWIQAVAQLCEQTYTQYALVEGQVVLTNLPDNELPTYVLSGYLADLASGEDLINATVAVAGTGRGSYTNEFGYFSIPLKRGKHQIAFSYVGYHEVLWDIDIKSNMRKSMMLARLSGDLPIVVIKPHTKDIYDEKSLGEIELSNTYLNNLPQLGSESDIVKGLTTQPGIKRHSDLSSFFYVRGGDRDQNVIIIDDAPIYNPAHFLGLSSMVIPDFAKSMTIYKSDVPTSMGDRLASIVSIRTRDGNLNEFQLSGALNPFVNRITAEIPVIKKRSSIFASFRRSAFELYNRDSENTFFFHDFHFKWNYKPSDKNRFFITLIQSADEYSGQVGELSNIRSGNFAATLRWNRTLGSRLFANTTLYTGNYSYVAKFAPNIWQSALGTLSLKSDFTHYASQKYEAKFGVELQGYFNSPGGVTRDSSNSLLPAVTQNYARKLVLYYQGRYDIADRLRVNAGFRMIQWQNTGPMTYHTFNENYEVDSTINAPEGPYNSYFNIDPRLSLQYKLNDDSQLKLSYGIYHQYLQLISNSVSPFTAMEVWLTASPHIKPQSSQQWALNYIRRLTQSKFEFSASAYYKLSKNQIDYDGHGTVFLNKFLEGELRFGHARAYGLELQLKKDVGRLHTSLAYTYSRITKKIKDINNDKPYRALQDRPHDLVLSLQYTASKRFFCSAFWTSYSGSPFTAPVGFYIFNEKTIPIYGDRNNERLPAYHRLDLSCQFILNKPKERGFRHKLTFSIYNVLGHKNIYALKFNKLDSDELYPDVPTNVLSSSLLSPSQIELAQFFPSLTYTFNL